jgi:hypothetical protein
MAWLTLVATGGAQQIELASGSTNSGPVLSVSSAFLADESPAAIETTGEDPPAAPASVTIAVAQPSTTEGEDLPGYSRWPRPMIEGGLSLLHGGYDPAAANAAAGLDLEARRWVATTSVSADDAHKTTSDSGYDAYLQARAFVRMNRQWFAGGGGQWNRLSANVYSKQAWRPAFGGGRDFLGGNFSARAQVVYVLAGDDRLNGSHGPEFSLWLPSPALRRHFFYHQTLGVYEFHQTSVPGDTGTNDHFVSLFAGFTIMYRF